MKNSNFIPCSELYDKPEFHYSWWGGLLLAKALISAIERGDSKFRQSKNIISLLQFLTQSKGDMLNFMYNDDLVICTAPIKGKNGKVKEYKPYRIMFNSGTPEKVAEQLEFISPPEKKWRDTAKIFLDALNSACSALSVLTGKSPDEIFNNLINGQKVEAPPEDEACTAVEFSRPKTLRRSSTKQCVKYYFEEKQKQQQAVRITTVNLTVNGCSGMCSQTLER